MGASHGRLLHWTVQEMLHGCCVGFDGENSTVQQSIDRMIAWCLHHLATCCDVSWDNHTRSLVIVPIKIENKCNSRVDTRPSSMWKCHESNTTKIQKCLDDSKGGSFRELSSVVSDRVHYTLAAWLIQSCLRVNSPLLGLEMSLETHMSKMFIIASRERLIGAVSQNLRKLNASRQCMSNAKTVVQGYSSIKILQYTLTLWTKAHFMANRLHDLSTATTKGD